MDPRRYAQAKELFLAACDRPEAERRTFVDRECGSDASLRAAVAELLDFDRGDDLSPPSLPAPPHREGSGARFEAGDVLAERYRVVARLGQGGMGEVYHAVDLTLGVPVALKFPRFTDATHRARLLDEVRLARSVTHPAVGRIYDIGRQGAEYFVSMEYIRGDDLGGLLKRVGRMPPERVAEIGYSLCQGLAAAHEAGVLHRDIKPSNILIDEAGDPKLIDFGIATPLSDRSPELAGTPSYMSPEQLDGGSLSERTDLWSFGAVLYEICTGRRPFEGASLAEMREAHRVPPTRPSTLGVPIEEGLELAMMAMLEVDPSRRPRNAAELARQLGRERDARDRSAPRSRPTASSESERRQLTVLHCEVHDPDGRIDALDPEDLHAFAECLRREFEGVADRYEASLGDHQELEATLRFGYPVAHEDAAVRAVLAALEIQERLREPLEALDASHGTRTRMRQGVHVGSAIVAASTDSAREPRLTGNVFRVARQLAQLGSDGDVLVSADCRRLLGERFEARRFGQLAGLEAHAVLGPHDSRAPSTQTVSSETPFVGREEELSLVQERVRRATSGLGQILLVSGDGGVGKSRLLRELGRRLGSNDFDWRQAQCSPYVRNTAFQPLVDLLRAELTDGRADPSADAARRFEEEAAHRALDATARHRLAELISLPGPKPDALPDAGADARRDQVLDALCDWLLRTSDHRVVVLVVEDLHWADPSTIDLLERLAEGVAGEAAIVIATHRPEWSPSWPARSHATTVNLSPLTEEQTTELVQHAGTVSLDPRAVARIVGRADGIPLFAEELARHASAPNAAEVPETLRDTLVARLDRMGEAKPIAQCAAVLGRDFDLGALVSISGRTREEVVQSVDALVREDFLLRTRRGQDVAYAFRHALVRDAAYSSLIRERRVALHSLALDTLRADPSIAGQAPEILALHAEAAGREPLIVEFRRKAAERAAERLAPREAAAHAQRALEALSWQPAGQARDVEELSLQSMLAVSLFAVEGFGSDVTERAIERARTLCVEVGDATQQMPILYGAFSYHEARADSRAVAVADDIARVAASTKDPTLENVAEASRGHFRLWNGDIESCRDILRRVRQTEDLETQRVLSVRFGDEPVVCSPATLAAAECALGDVAAGRRTLREAVKRAERLGHPMTMAAVLSFSGIAAQILDDADLCDELARQNEILCAEGGFPNWGTVALAQRGWIEIRTGSPASGIAKVESAIARCSTIGQRLYVQGMRVFVAEGELALGRVDAAATAAQEAIASADETDDRLFLPEAHRVLGDVEGARGRRAEAMASYRRSIEAAQGQRALLFELRAARSLARLLSEAGDADAARALLVEPLARVSDDASAADVRRAHAFLRQL